MPSTSDPHGEHLLIIFTHPRLQEEPKAKPPSPPSAPTAAPRVEEPAPILAVPRVHPSRAGLLSPAGPPPPGMTSTSSQNDGPANGSLEQRVSPPSRPLLRLRWTPTDLRCRTVDRPLGCSQSTQAQARSDAGTGRAYLFSAIGRLPDRHLAPSSSPTPTIRLPSARATTESALASASAHSIPSASHRPTSLAPSAPYQRDRPSDASRHHHRC